MTETRRFRSGDKVWIEAHRREFRDKNGNWVQENHPRAPGVVLRPLASCYRVRNLNNNQISVKSAAFLTRRA